MAPEPARQPGKQLDAWFDELKDLWHLEDPLDALPRRLNPNRAKNAMDWPVDVMLALMAAARATPGRHEYVIERLEKRLDERLQHGRPNRAQHTIAQDLEYITQVNPVRPREVPAMVHRSATAQGAHGKADDAAGDPLPTARPAKQIANQRIASNFQGKRKRRGDDERLPLGEEEQTDRKRARAGPHERRRRAPSQSEQGDGDVRFGDRPQEGEDRLPTGDNSAGVAESLLAMPQIVRPINGQLRNIVIPTDDVLNSEFVQQQPIPSTASRPQRIELLRLLRKRNLHIRTEARESEIDYLIRSEEILHEEEQADADAQQQDN